MAARDFPGRQFLGKMGERAFTGPLARDEEGALEAAPLGGTRAEAMQRLQIGLSGLVAMIMLVGIAGAIGSQAERAEQAAVPDAAPSTEPTAAPPQRDPLADAGVVPDIPVEPELEAAPQGDDSAISETAPDGTVTVPDTPPTGPKPLPKRKQPDTQPDGE